MAGIPDVDAFSPAAPQPAAGVAQFEPPNWRQVGMAGQVIQGAGRTLQDAANTVAATNERQDAIVAQSAANSLRQQTLDLQWNPQNGFAMVREGGVVGPDFVHEYQQRLEAAQTSIRQALTNPNQQRIFDQHAQINANQFQQAILEHQAKETEAFNDTTANDSTALDLRGMAQRPYDELNFQGGLAHINSTIDAMGARKGWSQQQTDATKGHFFDVAYSTRILSIANGIPGIAPPNPYMAEKLFKEVQSRLGPSQLQLGEQVQKALVPVQQQDLTNALFSGRAPTNADSLAPATSGTAPLAGIVRTLETGGVANPDAAVSPKGAQGAMQVMPGTAADPGYGVRPAAVGADGNPLPGELDRVGRDFLGAMTARYGNPALVLAAYNAGPGQVDKWIAQRGDPRTGQISTADWVSKIPFAETKSYVERGISKLGPQALTANQVKAQLPAMADQARSTWLSWYPGDTEGAEGAAARVMNKGRLIVDQQRAQQEAAQDTLTQSLVGQNAPKSIDDALSDPATKQAFDAASPEARLAYQTRLAKGDKGWDQQSMGTYYTLLGTATNDPENFGKVDLMQYYGKIPDAHLQQLMAVQKSVNTKELAQQTRDLNLKRAMSDVQSMTGPVFDPKLVGEAVAKNGLDAFTGRFTEALQQYHDQNNKWPDTQATRSIAAGLLAQGKVTGTLWDSSERYFQAQTKGEASKFYVPLPSTRSSDYAGLVADFTRAYGRPPANTQELQDAVTKQVLAGKRAPWMQ